VNLAAPGLYAAFDPSASSGCTIFPANGSASSAEYLLVPQSASGTPNDTQSFKLQGGGLMAATLAGQVIAPEGAPPPLSPAEQFHLFLRRAERVRSYPVPPGWQRGAAVPSAQFAPLTITPIDSGVKDTFKVCGNLTCDTPLPKVVATAQKVGQHIAIFVDDSAPPNGLTQSDLGALRAVFDTQLYKVDTTAFGRESDIDSNGVVIVLMTNKVNKLVTSPCSAGFIAGYFFGADIDPVFRASYNNAEIFYSIVADPTGTLSCAHQASQVKTLVPVTFVHEFQHMISYNQHVLKRSGEAEILWLNEALSHYAEERGGRSFLPDTATFCNYVAGDLFNSWAYDTATGNHFLVDTAGIGGLAERGAYWLFLRYLIDQFADTSLAAADAFTRTLDQTSATGVTNVQNAGRGTPFATLVERWSLANYVSDLPGFPAELQYRSWRFRTDYPLLSGRCPNASPRIPTRFQLVPGVRAGSAVDTAGVLRAGSGMYYRALQSAGAAGFTLLFSDAAGGALRASVVPRLNVIRIQ